MENLNSLKIGCGRFIFGKGVLQQLPEEILHYGRKAFVVGGPTTLPLVKNMVWKEMEAKGIEATSVVMTEPNSLDFASRLSKQAKSLGSQVIVAIGGGKCMDLCKVFSDMASIPIITVPTSVATCAGCSAVSILYTKDTGAYDCSIPKEREVDSVIADLDAIGKSPKRLFASGIMDSIAKLPEIVNGTQKLNYPSVPLQKYIAYTNSVAIYDFLTRFGVKIYENPMENEELLNDVILINLIITSMVSGFSSGSDQLAVAHGLYDGIRKYFPIESAKALHGEIVAVGVLMQMRFNYADEKEYQMIKGMMSAMNMPLTLNELGVVPDKENIKKLKEYNIMKNQINKPEDLQRLEDAFKEIS